MPIQYTNDIAPINPQGLPQFDGFPNPPSGGSSPYAATGLSEPLSGALTPYARRRRRLGFPGTGFEATTPSIPGFIPTPGTGGRMFANDQRANGGNGGQPQGQMPSVRPIDLIRSNMDLTFGAQQMDPWTMSQILQDEGAASRRADLSGQLMGGGDPLLSAYMSGQGRLNAMSGSSQALSAARMKARQDQQDFFRSIYMNNFGGGSNQKRPGMSGGDWGSLAGTLGGAAIGGYLSRGKK